MHRKGVFALAGVFLAVAVIVPLVILIAQSQNDLIIIQNPTGLQTSGNVTGPTFEQITGAHQTNNIIIAIVEAVFLSLFVITIYYGINHVHPTH